MAYCPIPRDNPPNHLRGGPQQERAGHGDELTRLSAKANAKGLAHFARQDLFSKTGYSPGTSTKATGLGFDQEIPHHSTFSKNRHGRFQESTLFRELFEEMVARCVAAGLVKGEHMSVDGSFIQLPALSSTPSRLVANSASFPGLYAATLLLPIRQLGVRVDQLLYSVQS